MKTKRTDAAPASTVPVDPQLQPLALRAPEAARAIGLSERQLWSLTVSGQIPCVRVGRAKLYPVETLRDWLRQCAKGGR